MKSAMKLLALVVVVGLLSIPVVRAANSSPAPAPAAAPVDQPHMQAALDLLRQAKAQLETAEADKGGHRAAAIRACNEAIRHTEEGIAYANHHH